jgi:RHS repeat-associated protein
MRKTRLSKRTHSRICTRARKSRLTQISQTAATPAKSLNASYTYDALGRRIQSSIAQGTNPAQIVQYLYEGAQALGEIRNGQLTHRLLTGLSLDETIARIAINSSGQKDAAQSRIYLTDALNSVIAQLSDDAANPGQLQNSYAYSPYGEASTVGPDGTNNPNQYTSRENDGTGLMFYRARYYDPVLKRFISSDPIGLAGGMNTFAYVEGDPISLIDSTGKAGAIPKNFGKGKPLPSPEQIPNQTKTDSERRQGKGQDAVDAVKCYFGFKNCDAEDSIKKALRCEVSVCTTSTGGTFSIDRKNPQCIAYDPTTTTCVCTKYQLDPNYIGGAPPGLTAPGR